MDHKCEEYLQSISKYIDNELPDDVAKSLKQHLENCENCSALYESILKTIDLYRVMESEIKIPEGLKQKIVKCLDDAEK